MAGEQMFSKDDRYVPFSNGTEMLMWTSPMIVRGVARVHLRGSWTCWIVNGSHD
jgi:hypothetical protein